MNHNTSITCPEPFKRVTGLSFRSINYMLQYWPQRTHYKACIENQTKNERQPSSNLDRKATSQLAVSKL